MDSIEKVTDKTLHWLEKVVVGLNLCPFAAPVLKQNSLHITVCEASDAQQWQAAVLQQLDYLQQSDEKQVATSLLVFSKALADFNDYLALVDNANALLEQAGLLGVIQIASFHPDYCFEGVAADDISNATNRSPYPMLHFIREAQLTRVLANYPNPEQIPDNNITRLRELGPEGLRALLS